MILESEARSLTDAVQGADPQVDSLVLSLLQAYCERIPALPSELRYLEFGAPPTLDGWRTRCVSVGMGARGVLLVPSSDDLERVQKDRPQDIVMHGRLGQGEDEIGASAPPWSLDDFVEQAFSFNRLDHLVLHAAADDLRVVRSCEFRVVRPYMLHVVWLRPTGRALIGDAISDLRGRDYVLIASRPRDLIFLDSLAFLRPEQSSSFIV